MSVSSLSKASRRVFLVLPCLAVTACSIPEDGERNLTGIINSAVQSDAGVVSSSVTATVRKGLGSKSLVLGGSIEFSERMSSRFEEEFRQRVLGAVRLAVQVSGVKRGSFSIEGVCLGDTLVSVDVFGTDSIEDVLKS